MLTHWTNLIKTDCKVVRIGNDYVYPIFKCGCTTLFVNADQILINEELQTLSTIKIILRDSIIFSTWLSLRKCIYHAFKLNKPVTIDFSETVLVDSHVQSKLDEWEKEFDAKGLEFTISGLDLHEKSGAILIKRK